MTEYTGADWPYEPIAEQKDQIDDGRVFILLAGKRDEVDAVQEITTSYSFLQRYGRQFERLYHLVLRRPDADNCVFEWESEFKHRIFSLSIHRLEVLRLLLDACDGVCYEVVYLKDGQRITETNFPAYEAGTLNDTLETALRAQGWTERKKVPKGCGKHYVTLEQWQERKKAPKQGPFHRENHLWSLLPSLFRKRRKAS